MISFKLFHGFHFKIKPLYGICISFVFMAQINCLAISIMNPFLTGYISALLNNWHVLLCFLYMLISLPRMFSPPFPPGLMIQLKPSSLLTSLHALMCILCDPWEASISLYHGSYHPEFNYLFMSISLLRFKNPWWEEPHLIPDGISSTQLSSLNIKSKVYSTCVIE